MKLFFLPRCFIIIIIIILRMHLMQFNYVRFNYDSCSLHALS